MKDLNRTATLIAFMLLFVLSCSKDDDDPIDEGPTIHMFTPGADNQDDVTEAFINVKDGEIIEFGEGTFDFNNTLSMINKNCVIIRGAGRNKTFLNFANQTAGAEGLKLTNTNNLLMEKFTVLDSEGDAIKVKDTKGLHILEVGVEWSGGASVDNGAYGLYPILCEEVTIDNCYVRGASDAGIYVGQSTNVHVKNSEVEENVAGIEIENCNYAEVYGCNAHGNTGGILVFDLPNLTIKNGAHCKIYDNDIVQNDHVNFAPDGNIVSNVASGTGILLMTTKEVEVFGNTITNNNTMGVGVVSYPILAEFDPDLTYDDPEYRPFVEDVYIHDNTFSRTTEYPAEQNLIGLLIQLEFPDGDMPDIVFDGLSASSASNLSICVSNNGSARFGNIDAANEFENIVIDPAIHQCNEGVLEAVLVAELDCE